MFFNEGIRNMISRKVSNIVGKHVGDNNNNWLWALQFKCFRSEYQCETTELTFPRTIFLKCQFFIRCTPWIWCNTKLRRSQKALISFEKQVSLQVWGHPKKEMDWAKHNVKLSSDAHRDEIGNCQIGCSQGYLEITYHSTLLLFNPWRVSPPGSLQPNKKQLHMDL